MTFDQPIAKDGKFAFINRTEVASSLSDLPKLFADEDLDHNLVFLINLVDATSQESVLSLLLLADNTKEPFVGLFPFAEMLSMLNPTPAYSTPTEREPPHKVQCQSSNNLHANHFIPPPSPVVFPHTAWGSSFHHKPESKQAIMAESHICSAASPLAKRSLLRKCSQKRGSFIKGEQTPLHGSVTTFSEEETIIMEDSYVCVRFVKRLGSAPR